ncbi:MAG: guanylate kinase [Thalassobaculales bacterium]
MSNDGVQRRGLMLVLSSPSGAGKTSISRRLVEEDAGIGFSVSATTRPMRPGEVDGRDYWFVDRPRFEAMVAEGALLEHAVVFGNLYGTPRAPVEAALAAGRDMLFDVDWQGAQQIAEAARDDLVSVFILPPSVAELARRLAARRQDPPEVVRARMERAADEMSHWAEYDYVIINHDLADSVARLRAILTAERLRRSRQVGLGNFVRALAGEAG